METGADGRLEAVDAVASALKAWAEPPTVAVVLGSGLGAFAEALTDATRIAYSELPGFPVTSVTGHAGALVVGRAGSGPDAPRVAALSGRIHLYEGHPVDQVVLPARAMARWGVKGLVVTNASGGIGDGLEAGDLLLIEDHINFTGRNPLEGPNLEALGPRFPDMSEAYDPELRNLIAEAAQSCGFEMPRGVYAGVLGPSYETPAEIRMLRTMGAQVVGMSTVLEVIAARHAGVRCAGISCVTNLAAGLSGNPLSHDEVKETAQRTRGRFIDLLNAAIPRLAAACDQ